MTDEELIESLRLWNRDDAADRIEALSAERDYTEGTNDTLIALNQDLEAKLAENEVRLRKAVERLEAWVELSEHCSIEEGVCCCGDNMENHTNPMDCGHMPLDHGTYIARHLQETTRAALAEIKSSKATTPYGLEGESHE